jgi:hypothetical protein
MKYPPIPFDKLEVGQYLGCLGCLLVDVIHGMEGLMKWEPRRKSAVNGCK